MPFVSRAVAAALVAFATVASAQPVENVMSRVKAHKQPFLDTLKELVGIESGSDDREGLDRISEVVARELRALGGEVRLIEPGSDTYRMHDTPAKVGRMVHATFKGTGTKKIMMIAHMDTVYKRGMLARQPFRVDGDKAYGLAIADDKQGIAMIIHAIGVLKDIGFREYGMLTVLINGDEEISTPGARNEMTRLGADHDVTMSFEASRSYSDKLSLATSGVGSVLIHVKGKASHSGSGPERGVNALVELANQVLLMKDLGPRGDGMQLNWTGAKAGSGSHNIIPEDAEAHADVRVDGLDGFDRMEKAVKERMAKQIVPNAKVELVFERRRPPLVLNDASRTVAEHAKKVYAEIGKTLVIDLQSEGGGTDAAFAGLQTKNAVIERFGAQGFGTHTADNEYILMDSIEPRMYLAARMVMDIAQGKVR
ncbi:MAG TPA: glutamate carboxypeptidase [Usitatibacter sp.]|nr:glutamate carboxypeptidase [Usitatibacter sp.]